MLIVVSPKKLTEISPNELRSTSGSKDVAMRIC